MVKKTINSTLYDLIENEISQTTKKNYYKNISIHEYDRATKRTLDLLVEKYGGFIYRDDHQVTLLINFSNLAPKHQARINRNIYQKITSIEQRLNQVVQTIQDFQKGKEEYYHSYFNYFHPTEDIKHDTRKLQELIDEVISHEESKEV